MNKEESYVNHEEAYEDFKKIIHSIDKEGAGITQIIRRYKVFLNKKRKDLYTVTDNYDYILEELLDLQHYGRTEKEQNVINRMNDFKDIAAKIIFELRDKDESILDELRNSLNVVEQSVKEYGDYLGNDNIREDNGYLLDRIKK